MKPTLMMDPQTPVSDVALRYPWSWRIFRSHGIDVCCEGGTTLAEACAARQIALDDLTDEIAQADTVPTDLVFSDQRTLGDLVQLVCDRYHARHRSELPLLLELAQECEIAYGTGPGWPDPLVEHLSLMFAGLEVHMRKEEEVLFPLILCGRGSHAVMPIAGMQGEHEELADDLRSLREMTNDFNPPANACMSWIALYRSLERMEDELMMHMHLENNVLFPRALREEVAR